MTAIPFLSPKLTGPRFDDHSIPLEFLKDLAALQEMLVAVAKQRYMKDHPERKRLPGGFTDGIDLKLTAIDEGSAIPKIALVLALSTLFPMHEQQSYFEQAREAIVSTIGAAERSATVSEFLSEDTLAYFDRVGRSLREGEAIEFRTPTQQTPVKLTPESRERLVLASASQNTISAVSVRGRIPEADQDDMTFEIQLADGRKLRAPIHPDQLDLIIQSFDGYATGSRVFLQGTGHIDQTGRIADITSVEEILLLDPLDIPVRVDELRLLEDGWLDGHGKAPSHADLDWLITVFQEQYPTDLRLPYLYPTEEGGIQAEWSMGSIEISLAIGLRTHIANWHELNLDTGNEVARELNLTRQDDWQWLAARIRRAPEVEL